jgi:hypothetical protein
MYLPNRKCGNGSDERERTCPRIQDSGRAQRNASSLLSINSYRNACKQGLATWVVVAILITVLKSSVYRTTWRYCFALCTTVTYRRQAQRVFGTLIPAKQPMPRCVS